MKKPPNNGTLVAFNRAIDATVYKVIGIDGKYACCIQETTPAPRGLIRASNWVDCSLVEPLTPAQAARLKGEKKFSVLLLYPDFLASQYGEDKIGRAHV